MGAEALPEGIITRFRSLSLERVGRVEGTWNSVIAGVRDPKAIRDLLRELHTLKGDSRIVGFDEIHLLAHKLEELFALAKMLDYRVSEDVELVITMSIQFLGMLLRRKQADQLHAGALREWVGGKEVDGPTTARIDAGMVGDQRDSLAGDQLDAILQQHRNSKPQPTAERPLGQAIGVIVR